MASRRPADWRFPTEKQQRAEGTARRMRDAVAPPRSDEDAWWDAVLADPRTATLRPSPAKSLGDIRNELLRVECQRCMRIVEIQRLDAIKLFGPDATWKSVGQKLLDDGCQHRTGRHEEDCCWPDFRNG
jgi:hypothetical protein